LRKKIENFEELSNFDIVVNCTGLGSLDLTKDTKMHPIRGQIIRVNAPWAYTVFSDDSDDGNYIIPK
jgi:D-amino-acid oxidase